PSRQTEGCPRRNQLSQREPTYYSTPSVHISDSAPFILVHHSTTLILISPGTLCITIPYSTTLILISYSTPFVLGTPATRGSRSTACRRARAVALNVPSSMW